jgi:hypothetical protein
MVSNFTSTTTLSTTKLAKIFTQLSSLKTRIKPKAAITKKRTRLSLSPHQTLSALSIKAKLLTLAKKTFNYSFGEKRG